MIEYNCGSCGARVESPRNLAGQQERCPNCGGINNVPQVIQGQPFQPQTPDTQAQWPPQGPTVLHMAPASTGKATASLVLGIVGLVVWCCPLAGLGVTIPGLVLGIKARKGPGSGRAIAGIILCVIGLVASIVNAIWGAYLGVTGQHPLFQ